MAPGPYIDWTVVKKKKWNSNKENVMELPNLSEISNWFVFLCGSWKSVFFLRLSEVSGLFLWLSEVSSLSLWAYFINYFILSVSICSYFNCTLSFLSVFTLLLTSSSLSPPLLRLYSSLTSLYFPHLFFFALSLYCFYFPFFLTFLLSSSFSSSSYHSSQVIYLSVWMDLRAQS